MPPAPPPRLPRLLIVDDERDNLDALKRLLRKDFEVVVCASGEEALETVASSKPFDVLLSDQRMPGISGSVFFEKVQEHDPIATRVLLTGFSDLEAVIEAVNRGHIWRYLSKPWEPDDLKIALKQAAERTGLTRSLNESRQELERALLELRARDASRERLLHILLHEFRTVPQILEGLRGLDPKDEDSAARARFIDRLAERMSVLETDVSGLLADEKRIASLPKQKVLLSEILTEALGPDSFEVSFTEIEPPIETHRETLLEGIRHLHAIVATNSGDAPVKTSVDLSSGAKPDLFVVFTIESAQAPLLPKGISGDAVKDPKLAWSLLLEPFIGAASFQHHSTGLRVETARITRSLAALGGRAEFQVAGDAKKVELVISVRATATIS